MDFVNDAVQDALAFYAIRVITLLVFIVLGFRHVKKNKPNSEKIGLLTIVLIACLIIYLFSVITPFVSDVICDNIVFAEGTYTNVLGDKSKSGSSMSGIYGVELLVGEELIHLTTVPWNEENFPQGSYQVAAYYTARSEMLLYMEILE